MYQLELPFAQTLKNTRGATTENILIQKNFFSKINSRIDTKESGIGITSNTNGVQIIENFFHNVDQSVLNQRRNQFVFESENYSASKVSKKQSFDFEINLSKWKIVENENSIKTFRIYQ